MTLTFDWFLPTSGDGRTIYGRGHSLPLAQAQAAERPPARTRMHALHASYRRFGEGVLPELRRRGAWTPPGSPSWPAANGGRELAQSAYGFRV
jgi:hypothetical protein